jgi:hypothetical protein
MILIGRVIREVEDGWEDALAHGRMFIEDPRYRKQGYCALLGIQLAIIWEPFSEQFRR